MEDHKLTVTTQETPASTNEWLAHSKYMEEKGPRGE